MERLSYLAHRAFDGALDLRYGISTWGTADDEFHPTSYRLLHRMFQRLGVTRDDVLIDLGCGFGRAVCVGAQYPFRRIRGVELDPATAEQAQRNVARLRTRQVADIRVDRADATEYDCADATIVHMFNPFNGDTFARSRAHPIDLAGARAGIAPRLPEPGRAPPDRELRLAGAGRRALLQPRRDTLDPALPKPLRLPAIRRRDSRKNLLASEAMLAYYLVAHDHLNSESGSSGSALFVLGR